LVTPRVSALAGVTTCFRIDIIDEVTEEDLDALLDDSEPFSNTSEKINESSLDKEYENSWLSMSKKILNKNPPTDLEMKHLPKHLKYAFLEKDSLLLVVISALLKDDEKKRLVSVLKKHKEVYLVGKILRKGLTYAQQCKFFSELKHYFWDEPYHFKMCLDGMIRRRVYGSETRKILGECHNGPTRGHYGPSTTTKKVFDAGFYWPTIFKEAYTLVQSCDAIQRSGFEALPTNDARVVIIFLKKLFYRFGIPKTLISDKADKPKDNTFTGSVPGQDGASRFMIRVVEENGRIHKEMELKRRSKLKLIASRHLFTVLDMPVDKYVPIVLGRTKKKKKDSEDGEEYYVKRDINGKPFYGPTPTNYLNCDGLLDRALALQEALNPFNKVCVWKKMVAFLGSLPVALQHMEWIPSYSDNFSKKEGGDGKWHTKIKIVDQYGNIYDQGCETKTTKRVVKVLLVKRYYVE
ncbi:reverse transcriptase domain-containing protein, partial [Tanacetum coccineum]